MLLPSSVVLPVARARRLAHSLPAPRHTCPPTLWNRHLAVASCSSLSRQLLINPPVSFNIDHFSFCAYEVSGTHCIPACISSPFFYSRPQEPSDTLAA